MSDTTDPPVTTTPPDLPIDLTNPMVAHANSEVTLAGLDAVTAASYMQAVQGFANLNLTNDDIAQITKLLNMENITPLTTNPSDWTQISDTLWTNSRNEHVYSQDGGNSYYVMDDLNQVFSVVAAVADPNAKPPQKQSARGR